MRIHILGIAGTFMAGIAVIAKQLGHTVEGSDQAIYPPMSTLLAESGIPVFEGYAEDNLKNNPDLIIVGNAIKRGNPIIEQVLTDRLPFISGPAWLSQEVLRHKHVLAISGTHGKTTTSSMLAWILEYAGLNPGFLIGGRPGKFDTSARLTDSDFFVIEADEYDTAFFDKRSKFVHYLPSTLVINNLEFDHADIFASLADIQKQFHHVVRTVPGNGTVIVPADDQNIAETLAMGCWTPIEKMGTEASADWSYRLLTADGATFEVAKAGEIQGTCEWSIWGEHNVQNALAAIAAAYQVGVPVKQALAALTEFVGSARRLDFKGEVSGIKIYEDFAHHPSAIAKTLQALKARFQQQRIVCALEFRSYTMRAGVHRDSIADALSLADELHILIPQNIDWDVQQATAPFAGQTYCYQNGDTLLDGLKAKTRDQDILVLMSNGGFEGIPQRVTSVLAEHATVNN